MPLWGNRDLPSGNQKPLFANTSNATSKSTIHGNANNVANSAAYYGNMMGVSVTEMAAISKKPQHAGWVSTKYGTGPIQSIRIVSGGQGYNTAGFLSVTDTSAHGQGAAANISYQIANAQNTMQSSSSNAWNNTIVSLAIVNGGSGFSNSSAITVTAIGANITPATFAVTVGGRGDRILYETIVAMGSITDDDPRDNVVFAGV
jgi:hypothetical protein